MLIRLSEVNLGMMEWPHGSWPKGFQKKFHGGDGRIMRGVEFIVRELLYLDISNEIRDVRSFFLPRLSWHLKQVSPGSRHSSSRVLMNGTRGRIVFGWLVKA